MNSSLSYYTELTFHNEVVPIEVKYSITKKDGDIVIEQVYNSFGIDILESLSTHNFLFIHKQLRKFHASPST